jgi:site-specific DNA-methyltransferase (adenine-specific)
LGKSHLLARGINFTNFDFNDGREVMPDIQLFNMDCMVAMKEMKDKQFDLAIVDPPYGLEKSSKHGRGKLKNRALNEGNIQKWDTRPNSDYFEELFRVSKHQIIWGGNYFGLPGTRGFLIWDKMQPFQNFSAAEYAWMSIQCPSKIFNLRATKTEDEIKIHPTQKPIKLYDWILHHFAQSGQIILDTHLGSGSSRIAAYKMGCSFVGFELDAEYYEKQETRFRDFVSQLALF